MNEWCQRECGECEIRWSGPVPCWCCGAEGVTVPPAVLVGAMRWDQTKEVIG